MKDLLYIAGVSSSTLASMFTQPNRFEQRAWSTEYTRRLLRNLLDASVNQSDDWMRQKQDLLSMKGPALRKVTQKQRVYRGVECLELVPKKRSNAETANKPLILFMHGGGYVIGSTKSYSYTLAKLALACDTKVVGVDYRLAPEHSLAELQDDCWQVLALMLEQGQEVILMGDSAGGALCLELASRLQKCSAEQRALVKGMVLWSPWVAPDKPDLLSREHKASDILSEAMASRWYADSQKQQPCPANYEQLDCKGLPPCYIQAGGAEIFIGQVRALAEHMRGQGAAVSLEVFPEQFHVFQTFAPLVKEADAAIEKVADFIRAL